MTSNTRIEYSAERKITLGEEDETGVIPDASPSELLAMVWPITQELLGICARERGKMLNENFRDMLSAFGEAGADYLLVGAYAMAAHGCPRATADIDIWVRPTEQRRTCLGCVRGFRCPALQGTLRLLHP